MQLLFLILQLVLKTFAAFCVARVLLHVARADFNNPITAAVVKLTNPVVRPLRRIVPSFSRFDLPTALVACLCNTLLYVFQHMVASYPVQVLPAIGYGIHSAVTLAVWIYLIAIFIIVILSWVAPNVYSPAASLARDITQPLLNPVKKMMPPLGGLDLSPMVVVLILILIQNYVLPTLARLFAAG